MCNEVMLVWGWLRLTTISVQLYSSYVIHLSIDYYETEKNSSVQQVGRLEFAV